MSGVKCIRYRQGWASVQNGLSLQEVNDKEHYATLKKKNLSVLKTIRAPGLSGKDLYIWKIFIYNNDFFLDIE